ncbi:hypothetical protein AHAS_Ahas01G0097100 [Arachis hypogaea]
MDCFPVGLAAESFMVQSAMKLIIRDNFVCYTRFRKEMAAVLDNLLQMPYRSYITAFNIYKKASVQSNQLYEFHEWCRAQGLCGSYEYALVDPIPHLQIKALETFLSGMWQLTEDEEEEKPLIDVEDDQAAASAYNPFYKPNEHCGSFPRNPSYPWGLCKNRSRIGNRESGIGNREARSRSSRSKMQEAEARKEEAEEARSKIRKVRKQKQDSEAESKKQKEKWQGAAARSVAARVRILSLPRDSQRRRPRRRRWRFQASPPPPLHLHLLPFPVLFF